MCLMSGSETVLKCGELSIPKQRLMQAPGTVLRRVEELEALSEA